MGKRDLVERKKNDAWGKKDDGFWKQRERAKSDARWNLPLG